MNQFTEHTTKAHLFNLIDQTDDKLSYVDRNYIYRAANKAYIKEFSQSFDEIIGHHIQDIVGTNIFETIIKPNLDKAFKGEEIYYETWFDFSAEKRSYLIVRYHPEYGNNGEVLGVVVTATDITYRKKLEEEKVLQDKLLLEQARLAQLGEMVSFIAHQWRRPLHTLATYLLRIRQEIDKGSCSWCDEAFERSEAILEHLSESIESLYSFHVDQIGAVQVKVLIEEVKRFLEPRLNAANITLENNIPETIILHENIPNSRMMHLFLVFIENAIEALEKANIDPKKIILDGYEEKEAIIIDIHDNGNGISSDIAHRIFEAGVSSKERDGHGFGLYFARKILTDQLGGNVSLIPTEIGGWFQLTFPKQHYKMTPKY